MMKRKKKDVESKSDLRYRSNNVSSIEDSIGLIDDEEVPEFQDPSDLPEDESKIDLTALMKKLDNKSVTLMGK